MLNIGDVLNLETLKGSTDKLKCKVVERKDNQLFIDYPVNALTGQTTFLMIGTELIASFASKDQQAFRFKTEVTGRVKENIPMISLTYPGDNHLVKLQRREFVRIEAALDVAIHPINHEFKPIIASTVDISAGGTAVILPKSTKLKQGQDILVWFSLPFQNESIEYLKIQANIIRFIPFEHNSFMKVPLQFNDIDETTRQTIIRYCFQQQIEMRKKGVITE